MNDFGQTELETIELTIEDAKQHVERHNALERLYDHPDFKLLISSGLFETEAIRLVRATGFPANRNQASQELLAHRINMISELQMYFQQIVNEGTSANAALNDHYLTKEEIIKEMNSGDVVINGEV